MHAQQTMICGGFVEQLEMLLLSRACQDLFMFCYFEKRVNFVISGNLQMRFVV